MPSVGQIALAFLQASFAFSGWNFLNYVTEEVVEPRRWAFGLSGCVHFIPYYIVQFDCECMANVWCGYCKIRCLYDWRDQLTFVSMTFSVFVICNGGCCGPYQESTSCHIHLHPIGYLCLHPHQHRLLLLHVTWGAAFRQRCGRGE